MSLSAIAVESFAQNVLCATSSHFCSAEKQFRFPLELGNQRPPTAQWTVTGSGAAIISKMVLDHILHILHLVKLLIWE